MNVLNKLKYWIRGFNKRFSRKENVKDVAYFANILIYAYQNLKNKGYKGKWSLVNERKTIHNRTKRLYVFNCRATQRGKQQTTKTYL